MTDWTALLLRKHARILTSALDGNEVSDERAHTDLPGRAAFAARFNKGEPMDMFKPKPSKTAKTPPKPQKPLHTGVPGKKR